MYCTQAGRRRDDRNMRRMMSAVSQAWWRGISRKRAGAGAVALAVAGQRKCAWAWDWDWTPREGRRMGMRASLQAQLYLARSRVGSADASAGEGAHCAGSSPHVSTRAAGPVGCQIGRRRMRKRRGLLRTRRPFMLDVVVRCGQKQKER
ncbi:hypothetical protein DENSPDRAFT_425718 [Dentipellis sp. KUC8613]|nr:hypothetical protein DENSPDRAFT_425718 [Dentipellis sp. KUC8613]